MKKANAVPSTVLVMILAVLALPMMFGAAQAGEVDQAERDSALFVIGATTVSILKPSPPVVAGGIVLAMLNAGHTYAADCPKELYNAPNVQARHKGETGYQFEVTACDYSINKANLELVK